MLLSAPLLPACGGEPCARLSKALCAGGDDDYCAAVDAWLQSRLVDPETKAPLQGEARAQMCTSIYDNVEIFHGYKFKARQKIYGEPDFILASQKRAQEEMRAFEEAQRKLKEQEDQEAPVGANMSD